MLVVQLKIGEFVKVGDSEIHVVKSGKYSVRLGVKADPKLLILRGELVKEENADGKKDVPLESVRECSCERVNASVRQ